MARTKLLSWYQADLFARDISDIFEIFGKDSVHEDAYRLLQSPDVHLLLSGEKQLLEI